MAPRFIKLILAAAAARLSSRTFLCLTFFRNKQQMVKIYMRAFLNKSNHKMTYNKKKKLDFCLASSISYKPK